MPIDQSCSGTEVESIKHHTEICDAKKKNLKFVPKYKVLEWMYFPTTGSAVFTSHAVKAKQKDRTDFMFCFFLSSGSLQKLTLIFTGQLSSCGGG